jgi:hypothetical protein
VTLSRDPFSVEEIEWTLWCMLVCECERCKSVLPLKEFDPLLDDSPIEWAKAAAPYVKAKGWSAPGEWELLCDKFSTPNPAT